MHQNPEHRPNGMHRHDELPRTILYFAAVYVLGVLIVACSAHLCSNWVWDVGAGRRVEGDETELRPLGSKSAQSDRA